MLNNNNKKALTAAPGARAAGFHTKTQVAEWWCTEKGVGAAEGLPDTLTGDSGSGREKNKQAHLITPAWGAQQGGKHFLYITPVN